MQGIDVGEQTTFGVVLKTVSGLVGIHQAAEIARGIDQLRQLPEGVVRLLLAGSSLDERHKINRKVEVLAE